MSSTCWRGVAEPAQRPRDRLVDDRHRAAADQLLHLDQAEVGLDAGGVAVHHQPDRPGGRQDAGLRVAHAVLLAVAHGVLPGLLAGGHAARPARRSARSSSWLASRCIRSTPQHVLLVVGEPGERAHPAGDAGARGVGVAGHQRRDGRRPGPAVGRVVGQAERHQQGAEVGVAEAELAEVPRRLADLRRRVVGPPDEDLLRREHDLDRVAEGVDVERALVVEEVQQVDRGQVAGAVVEVHVLRAGVRPVDPARRVRRVPAVDRRVELQAGVGALPRRLGDLAPQVAGLDGAQHLAGGDGDEAPVGVLAARRP